MQSDSCQFVYENQVASSVGNANWSFKQILKRKIWNTMIQKPIDFAAKKLKAKEPWYSLKKHLWQIGVLGLSEYISRILPTARLGRFWGGRRSEPTGPKSSKQKRDIHPGDWVEIKSFEEIFPTLDSEGKFRGLAFTKEMLQYCGRRFRVYKRLQKIILESTGEMRTIRTPTVILENVFCNGEAHGNCDRTCFCFWRESWLSKIPSPEDEK